MSARKGAAALAAVVLVAVLAGVALAGPADVDPAFGVSGVATLGFTPRDLVRDASGRIVVASAGVVERLLPGGGVDPAFGGGAAVAPADGMDIAAIAVQADGKVLLAGTHLIGPGARSGEVERLNADGTLDTTFGTNGSTFVAPPVAVNAFRLDAITVAGDGRIVVAGNEDDQTTELAFVSRLRVDAGHVGEVDGAFGTSGYTTYTSAVAEAVTTTAARKVVVAGTNGSAIFVARTNADGSPDTSFGSGGVRTPPTGFANAYANSVVVSGTRTIIGGDGSAGYGVTDGIVAGLADDGTLDPTFGTAGVRSFSLGGTSTEEPLSQLALRTDGEILTAGTANGQAALARLTPAGQPDTRFGARSAVPGTKLTSFPGKTRVAGDALAVDGDGALVAGRAFPPGDSGYVGRVGTPDRPPVVDSATVPATTTAGTSTALTAAASDPDPDDAAPVIHWDFGDGQTGTGASLSHAWAQGSYTVTVTATDAYGATSAPRTFPITVTNPFPSFDVHINAPAANRLLSQVRYPFSVTVTGDQNVKLDWDFGENLSWTEADLVNPVATHDFRPDLKWAGSHFANHLYAPRFGVFAAIDAPTPLGDGTTEGVGTGAEGTAPQRPPSGQTELKQTLLVRVRAIDGPVTKYAAVPVTVQGDQPPVPRIEASCVTAAPKCPDDGALPYSGASSFDSLSTDPDNSIFKNDPGRRDRIIHQRWDLGDGTVVDRPDPCTGEVGDYEACERNFPLEHDYFQAALDRAHLPALDRVSPGVFTTGVTKAPDGVAAYAAALRGAEGDHGSAHRSIGLTVTDAVGLQSSRSFDVPVSPQHAPHPSLYVDGDDTAPVGAGQPQTIRTPIRVGNHLTLHLNPDVDPNGRDAYSVVSIGEPADGDCMGPLSQGCPPGGKGGLDAGDPAHPIVTLPLMPGKQRQADISFPYTNGAKPLSVLYTTYDETGAVGSVRYDGFKVADSSGTCANIAGQAFGPLTVSGSCVSYASGTHGSVYFTRGLVTLNGLKVKAADPKLGILWTDCDGEHRLLLTHLFIHANCKTWLKATAGGDLDVLAGDTPVAKLDSGEQTALTNGVTDARPLTKIGGATYGDLPVEPQNLTAALDGDKSVLNFYADLPSEFGAGGGTTSVNSHVEAQDVADVTVITPFNAFAAFAPRRRPHAHAADVAAPSLVAPPGASLAGIPMAGAVFTYDPSTEDLTAHLSTPAIPLLGDGYSAAITITLHQGRFRDVIGDFNGIVPLAAAIDLSGFHFLIDSEGGTLTMRAQVDFQDALAGGHIVKGDGALTFAYGATPSVSVDGNATVADLLPAHVGVSFGGEGVGLNASTGADYGIASFHIGVGGNMDGSHYQLHGDGSASLLGASIGLHALASDRGLAGCGTIKLLVLKLSAGLGLLYPSSFRVLSGSCDLGPFASAEHFTRAGGTTDYHVKILKTAAATSLAVSAPAGANPAPRLGQVPQIDVLGPDGTTLATTSTTLGASAQTKAATLEQDALAGVDRILIPRASYSKAVLAKGYTVRVKAGTEPIAPPAVAYSYDPVTSKLFSLAHVSLAPAKQVRAARRGHALIVGDVPGAATFDKPVHTSVSKALHASAKPRAGLSAIASRDDICKSTPTAQTAAGIYPAQSGIELGTAKVTAPAKPVVASDSSVPYGALFPYQATSLLKFAFKGAIPPGQCVTFIETNSAGKDLQTLATAEADASETVEGSFLFHPSLVDDTAHGATTHYIRAVVADADGLPRGSVDRLGSFRYTPANIALPPSVTVTQPKDTKPGTDFHSVEIAVNQPTGLGGNEFGAVSIAAGGYKVSFPLSGAGLAATASQVRGRRSARALRAHIASAPAARFPRVIRLRHVPAHVKLKVTVSGVATGHGHARRAHAVLRPHQHRVRLGHRIRVRHRHKHRRHHRHRRHG